MYSSRTIEHRPANAVRGDLALIRLADALRAQFPWLDNAYGLAKSMRDREGRKTLATYAGNNEYIDLVPTGSLGNYLALKVLGRDAENADAHSFGMGRQDHLIIELIAFFDFRQVFQASPDDATEENVVELFRNALVTSLPVGMIAEVGNVYHDPETVFDPADLTLTDPVLFRRPYGCIGMQVGLSVGEIFYCSLPNNN